MSSKNNDSVFFKVDKNDKIIVQALGDKGCSLVDTIKVSVFSTDFDEIKLTANPKTILKGENSILSEISNKYNYTWYYKNDSIISKENSIKVKPFKTTYYTLKIQKEACTIMDTIHINVIEDWECDFPYIFVPNAFSPNDDGENDILYVRGRPAYEIEFRIFNRWGENVFYTNDLNHGWDGFYKGQKLSPDVYDYYLIVRCIDEKMKQIQGNITLLK